MSSSSKLDDRTVFTADKNFLLVETDHWLEGIIKLLSVRTVGTRVMGLLERLPMLALQLAKTFLLLKIILSSIVIR